MNFVKGIWILTRKEVKDSFEGPLVYILAGLFSLITGWLFFNYLMSNQELTDQTLLQTVLVPAFGNMNFIFLFLAPLITMRLFAEERKLHTLELLLGSDLSHSQIIIGKFFSSMVMTLFMLTLTLVFPVILAMSGYSNWSVVASSYLGITFCIMCYVSVGLFTSSLTENQIVAALASFCILMGIMLFVITTNATNNQLVSEIFFYISTPSHFEGFTRGVLKSYDFVYFGSFVGFFFYLTHLSLDSRNW